MNEFIKSLEKEAPLSFEKWLEVTIAQELAALKGNLIRSVLEKYSLNDQEWNNARDWWNNHYNANTAEMKTECGKVSDRFRIRFGLSPHDFDENGMDLDSIIPARIEKMILAGDENKIISYLHTTFPDHIDDIDYLDRYMDMATDSLAEKNKGSAMQKLLGVRYDFCRIDEEKEEWIRSETDMLIADPSVDASHDTESKKRSSTWQDNISPLQKILMKGTGAAGVILFIVGINLTVRGESTIGGWLSGIGMFIAVQLYWVLGRLYGIIENRFPDKLRQYGYSRFFWLLLITAYIADTLGIIGIAALASDNLPETFLEIIRIVIKAF